MAIKHLDFVPAHVVEPGVRPFGDHELDIDFLISKFFSGDEVRGVFIFLRAVAQERGLTLAEAQGPPGVVDRPRPSQ